MRNSTTIASQILKIIPKSEFNKLSTKHHVGHKFRKFTRFDQFVTLLSYQMMARNGIRDILSNLKAQSNKLYHIGFQLMSRSSFSRINNEQSFMFYEELFYKLSASCQPLSGKHKFKFKNHLYSMDASTIDLCLSVFPWAKFRKNKGAVKLHTVINHAGYIPEFQTITDGKVHEVNEAKKVKLPKGSILVMDRGYIDYQWFNELNDMKVFFVTRSKTNMKYKVVKRNKVNKKIGVTSDQIIKLTSQKGALYLGVLRRVGFKNKETGKQYYFLTNQTSLCAKTIADIYKDRWQIELFFKWIKQHLKVKKFIGESKNAVFSQIWVAMIAYLMISYFKWSNKIKSSEWEILQLLQVLWLDNRDLVSLFKPELEVKTSVIPQLEFEEFMGH